MAINFQIDETLIKEALAVGKGNERLVLASSNLGSKFF